QEKMQRIDIQKKAYENQQDFIRQQERFVERFKAKASKAAQAQSIMKRLDKIERIENTDLERPNIRINFTIDKAPGRTLCTLKNVSKKFSDVRIIEHTHAEINRGDKIGLIGANGKGKSTLLRIVAGTETFQGERAWGHNVDDSFYAQHQLDALNINNTVLEEMQRCGSGKTELELRSLLGCFLFSGDDVEKKIKVLSGGEKARVALAKTIVSKANFLLLDEPTNHLDIHSVDLLIESLNKYEGSYILVSHDRYFVNKTANKIWEIENYKIKEFVGGYDEWEEMKKRKAQNISAQANASQPEVNNKKKEKKNNPPPPVKVIDKDLKKEHQKIQKQFQQLEEKIAILNEQKIKLESALSSHDIYSDKNKFVQTETDYKTISADLQKANTEYENVFEKLMELENKIEYLL
ncbi:MAG: ATP-binding cassette domain-containing protein, partial [Ginsengibacter sp.]